MSAKNLLRWIYLGRLTLAGGIFAAAMLVWSVAQPTTTRLATIVLLLAVAATLAGFWHTHLMRRLPGRRFLYAQVVVDVVLVTLVVHMTGGAESDFAPLFIPVIAAAAVLLPLPGGLLVGGLASSMYIADLVWWHSDPLPGTAFLQIGIFAVMALATGTLGDRLRRTGRALGELESELRQLRLDTTDILSTLETGVVSVDGEGRLAYINPAAEVILGVRGREWIGRPFVDELDTRAPGLGVAIQKTAETRVPIRRYETQATPVVGTAAESANGGEGSADDGSWRGAAARAARTAGWPEGRVLGVRTTILERDSTTPWITAVFQDITASKRADALNRRAERLEAIAELASSLAHEIRNPLASIRSAVEQLTNGRLPDRDRSILERLVVTESDRLSRLLSDFLEFSRVEVRGRQPVDVANVAESAVRLAEEHPDGGGEVHIELGLGERPVEVEGDGDLLHRAIFNLVLNAVQHAGPGGKVRVELRRARGRELPAGLKMTEPVRLSVSDSGPGIPEDVLSRVFDPFFTTRAGGTGLGLAVVHRAVQAHNGTILVNGKSDTGGAQFVVYLPGRLERQTTS
ncbi:MAG TPA: ATP-binding protein [Longimicrobiales bacterium]|nr:ATP-binding protein [Longimicrobiales bacterium]